MLTNRNRGWHPLGGALLTIWATIFTALLTASAAVARGGGGSHGFSGGSHSSGGSSSSHIGHSTYYSGGGTGSGTHVSGAVIGAVIGGIVGLVLIIVLGIFAYRRTVAMRRQRGASKRAHRVETAAAAAAEDDAAFASDTVHKEATELFLEIQDAWDKNDRARLQGLVGPELWKEWKRRLDDFDRKRWRNRVQPVGMPKVKYVGLRNVADDREDRVVVMIEATLHDYVVNSSGRHIKRSDSSSETSHMCEYWTLAKRGGQQGDGGGAWTVLSIEQVKEGAHELKDEIVATPDADEGAMRDEALVEGATAEAVPEGTKIAEVADLNFEGDARAAANDLSLADGRFAPDVLEIAARRAVAAWAEAIDGDDDALEAIADEAVVRELLHPGDPSEKTRLVIRGPAAEEIRITGLDAQADPPTMSLELRLAGCRYIENRDTTEVVSGSASHRRRFSEHWTMGLTGDKEQPWRIVAVGAPVGKA
jgi:predicted lipid-binding transport protein (Tim44 family)